MSSINMELTAGIDIHDLMSHTIYFFFKYPMNRRRYVEFLFSLTMCMNEQIK